MYEKLLKRAENVLINIDRYGSQKQNKQIEAESIIKDIEKEIETVKAKLGCSSQIPAV